MTDPGDGSSAEVTRLPTAQTPPPPEPPSAATGLHAFAIGAMATCAILGIGLVFALITLRWSGEPRRYLIVALVLTAVGFMSSAATAVFAAARDTYPRRSDKTST